MSVYTYTAARQKLAQLLDEAHSENDVFIKRKNGQTFQLVLIQEESSGLDVPSANALLKPGELMDMIRAAKERH